jgi:fructan beta-fructosidase
MAEMPDSTALTSQFPLYTKMWAVVGKRPFAELGLAVQLLIVCLGNALAIEPFRPMYHFTPERNWINDPNGLVFFQGEYHLFFQYNPFGDKWGHMSWGHAVSGDLVHWEQLPVALTEADGLMIFSGSAVVDWNNTSGFGQHGQPPLVAIYTAHRPADGRQAQCLAWSNDRARTWVKFSGNPVLDLHSNNFRDPKVFWHEQTKSWIMVVALAEERRIQFYGSPDLKHWARLSEFGPAGATKGVWECPDLFPLSIEGHSRKKHWVLVVNVGSGSQAGGSGTQYFIGQFDGHDFWTESPAARPQDALWADSGRDCYAAVSWSDIPESDGRRIWLGWMSNWEYAQDVPTSPWRNAMTIPRALSLRETPSGMRLVQKPVRELERLRIPGQSLKKGDVLQANDWLRQHPVVDSLEMNLELEPDHTGQCGVRVLKSQDEETVIGFDEVSRRMFLDRSRSGNTSFNKTFPEVHQAPVAIRDGKLKLHLFIDACSIELFVNDGELVFTDLVFPARTSRQIELFSRASLARVRSLEMWPLRPAFTRP